MRKFLVLCFAFVLLVPFVSYAASIGGAETQGKGKVAVGLDNDFVFNRDLKYKGPLVAGEEYKNVELDSLYRLMAKASYGVLDNLDVYVMLGIADGKGDDENYIDGAKQGVDKLELDSALAYGFGMKGTSKLANEWLVGCDLQFVRHKHESKTRWIPVAGSESTTTYKSAPIYEWHIAPYVAREMGDFMPYLGVKYSDFVAKFESGGSGWSNFKEEADDNFGVFLGTDCKMGENWKVNLEGRFIDETAMSVGCTYKF